MGERHLLWKGAVVAGEGVGIFIFIYLFYFIAHLPGTGTAVWGEGVGILYLVSIFIFSLKCRERGNLFFNWGRTTNDTLSNHLLTFTILHY